MSHTTTTPVRDTPGQRENRKAPRWRRRGAAEARAGWILGLPFLVLFGVFTVWPVLQSFLMSVTDTGLRDIRNPFSVTFIGLDNYLTAIGDPVYRQAVVNTLIFVVFGVPLTMACGLAAAVALDKGITKLRGVYRMAFYTPVVTSIVAVAVVWRFLLEPRAGLFNTVLGWVGIEGPNWLGDPDTALLSLIMMTTWRNFGTSMIIFLAGLQSVPWELHEAAALDGASPWRRFWAVSFPLLRPTFLFVLVTTTIGYLQFFEEPFVMTEGGPLNSTISASMYTYNQFGFGNLGVAGAMAYLTFIAIVIVTLIQFRVAREKD